MTNKILSTTLAILMLMLGVTSASAQNLSAVYPGGRQALDAFASPTYNIGRGGRQATLDQVARDLERADPDVFHSHRTRTAFVLYVSARLGQQLSAGQVANLLRSRQVRVVPCGGEFVSAGYHAPTNSLGWLRRGCRPGEQWVEVDLGGGQWTPLFSLGCLNPIDGQARISIADPCPNTWVNPQGPATRRQQVTVFVPEEAVQCLPPALRCNHDCIDWARGLRTQPASPDIAAALYEIVVRHDGRAYYLDEDMAGINLPASLSVALVWCDDRIHGRHEADFMEVRRR
jgi:hypothetical protein